MFISPRIIQFEHLQKASGLKLRWQLQRLTLSHYKRHFNRPSTTFQEQYAFLADSFKHIKEAKANLPKWTTKDLTIRLAVLSIHRFRLSRQGLLNGEHVPEPVQLSQDQLEHLNFHLKMARAAYARDSNGFWERAAIPQESCQLVYHSSMCPEENKLLPVHFILVDHATKRIVFSVRGSQDISDFATVLRIHPVKHSDSKFHGGIAAAAEKLSQQLSPRLDELMKLYPDYDTTFTGHSLGAGIAALMAIILREEYHGSIKAVCFACPPICSLGVAQDAENIVTCIINGHDFIPRFSAASLVKLKRDVSQFDWKTALAEMVPGSKQNFSQVSNDRIRKMLNEALSASYKPSELVEIARAQLQVGAWTPSQGRFGREFDSWVKNLEDLRHSLNAEQFKNLKAFVYATVKRDEIKNKIRIVNSALEQASSYFNLDSNSLAKGGLLQFQEARQAWESHHYHSLLSGDLNSIATEAFGKFQAEVDRVRSYKRKLIVDIRKAREEVLHAQKDILNTHLKDSVKNLFKQWNERKIKSEQPTFHYPLEDYDTKGHYEEDLYPAGKIYVMMHVKKGSQLSFARLPHENFEKLLLSPKMVSDHLLYSYRLNLNQIMQSQLH